MRFVLSMFLCFIGISPVFADVDYWWPKQNVPSKIVKLSYDGSLPQQMLAQSLSGLAAQNVNEGKYDELVWIQANSQEYEYLFNKTVRRLEIDGLREVDVWELIGEYFDKGIINGYILYSQNDTADCESDRSVNIATSVSGVLGGILVEESVENKVKGLGLEMLYDARGRKSLEVLKKYKSKLNRKLVLAAAPDKANMRDMAIAHRCMAVYGIDEVVEEVYKWLKPLSPVMGWNVGDEFGHVSLATKWGLFETVSDWCINIPVISAGSNKASVTPAKQSQPWNIDFDNKQSYTSFLFSDGDNVQWNMGGFNFSKSIWANENHGKFPMSWTTASANLVQVSPETLNYRAKSQPKSTSLVDFSGGYFYPDLFASERSNRKELLSQYAKRYSESLKKTGVNVICMLCQDVRGENAKEAYRIFSKELDGIIGMVAMQYAPYDGGDGDIFWFKNKDGIEIPVVTVKYSTWAGASWQRGGSPEKIAKLIRAQKVSSDSNNLGIVSNHAWSTYDIDGQKVSGLDAVKDLYDRIKEDVSVVNIEEFVWRVRMEHDAIETNKVIDELKEQNLNRNIWLVDVLTFAPAEQTMVVTLQGLLADDSEDVIMVRSGGISSLMVQKLRANGNKIIEVDTPWEMLLRFKNRISGAIVYDPSNGSINAATSLCGPFNAIAVTKQMVSHLKNVQIPVIKDVSGYDARKLFDEYKEFFVRGMVVEQDPAKNIYLRDFAIANNCFTYYGVDEELQSEILSYFGPSPLVYGWGADEYGWVKDVSNNNATTVPANWCRNLSVMDSLKFPITKRDKVVPKPVKEGERIVAFVMTDGDNIQWMAGGFVTDYGFWANGNRGDFNMSWEMAPDMADVCSFGLDYFYKTAASGNYKDCFVAGPSGSGYCFPSYRTDNKEYATQTAEDMKAAQLSLLTILDADGNIEISRDYLEREEIDGVLYKDFAPYHKFAGQIYWHNGKPAVSYKYVLWEGLEGGMPKEVAESISKMPSSPATNQDSYALINVHAWSYGNVAGPLQQVNRPLGDIGGPMEAVKRTIDLLPENTRVVTAEEFMILLRDNFGTPVK
ncbi:MAG: hypothetical protein ACIAQZ_11900 [Sedimentisphaeraceae bacterium JB056]